MPGKMSSNQPLKKSKKNRKPRKRVGGVPSTIEPVSRFMLANMGYSYYSSMTEASALTGAIYQFRLNSVYDPDFTSTGSTAQGYAIYYSLYGLFRVMRVRVIVRFFSTSSGNMTVGFIPGLNSTVTSNWSALQGQPFARSAVLQGNTGGAHSIKQFDQTIDLPQVCGITPAQYRIENDYAHGTAANPAKSVFLTLFMNGHSGTVQSTGFEVRLIFQTELSQPLQTITN